MRLVCPNCDAQYEVDTAAIPDVGRDVQCSNCGHAWFQMHPDAEAELQLEQELYDGDEADLPPPPAPDAAPPPARAPLDDTALSVLREEAAREAAQRQTERQTERRRGHDALETQPDLGLVAPAVGAVAAERAAALMRRSEADAPPPAAAAPQAPPPTADAPEPRPTARRELLPDIEEINSTLRASTDRRADETPADLFEPAEPARRGFRAGFFLMLILAGCLATTYVMAPRIMAQMPAAQPALAAYVGTVDRARMGLNAALYRATEAVLKFTGSGG